MPINYNPEDSVKTWPIADAAGKPIDYQAVLTGVVQTTSKTSGKPMEVWDFTVYGPDGATLETKEYVVIPAATFKIKQLARAMGMEKEFNAAMFQAEDHINSTIIVNLIIESQEGYDDKNKIGKYIGIPVKKQPGVAPNMRVPPRQQTAPVGAPYGDEQQFKDDDIPF